MLMRAAPARAHEAGRVRIISSGRARVALGGASQDPGERGDHARPSENTPSVTTRRLRAFLRSP